MSSPAAAGDAAPLVLRQDDAGIATLTLNRPAQFNALSRALIEALAAELAKLHGDESVRVVVLAGAGKAFCAGHDLKELKTFNDPVLAHPVFALCGEAMLSMMNLPQPVIARVHGVATAAGCQLVAACDLAVASSEARFATSGINVGLFCSTPGVALSRNVPRKKALEMLLTGDYFDAQAALACGLVNHVVAPDALDAAVHALAAKITAKPRQAIADGKRVFYEQIEMNAEGAYSLAADEITRTLFTAETQEGLDAFLQKRPPRWS
ncbi:MAG: enoyl-CoA hydratase [Burkholderiales bacterium]